MATIGAGGDGDIRILGSDGRSVLSRVTKNSGWPSPEEYGRQIEADSRPKQIKASALYEALHVPREVLVPGRGKRATKVSGRLAIVEASVDRNRNETWSTRVQHFNGWRQLNHIRTGAPYRRSKVLESCGDPFQTGSDFLGSPGLNDEFRPLTLGPFNRQMYLTDMLDMFSRVFEATNYNPLARTYVNIGLNFILAQGPVIRLKSPSAQAVWDEFAKRTSFEKNCLRLLTREKLSLGDAMARKRIINGLPWVSPMDASTVWEIVTDPQDINRVFYYYQQFPTQYQMFPGDHPASEYVIDQIPPEDVWHLLSNNSVGEKRGRSDLLPNLTNLKRYRDILNAVTVKAQLEAAVVWRRSLKASADELAMVAADPLLNRALPPGSILWENENMKTEPLVPAFGAAGPGYVQILEMIVALFAATNNLPPEYFGVTGKAASRAIGLVKADPSAKMFISRQDEIREFIVQVVEWVVGWYYVNGKLPRLQPTEEADRRLARAIQAHDYPRVRKLIEAIDGDEATYQEPLDLSCEVIMPPIVEEDRSIYLRDNQNAWAAGVSSHKRLAENTAARMEWREYDYDEEQLQIALEREAGIVSPLSMPAPIDDTDPDDPSAPEDPEDKESKDRQAKGVRSA